MIQTRGLVKEFDKSFVLALCQVSGGRCEMQHDIQIARQPSSGLRSEVGAYHVTSCATLTRCLALIRHPERHHLCEWEALSK
jgi:hypothetical protein